MFMRQVRKLSDLKNLLIINFLCLLINLFFVVMQIRQGLFPVETYFQPSMSNSDKALLLNTLQKFIHTLDHHNLTYLMYGGTLIGSYRHHGPIPWDDDIDLILNASQKIQIKEALKELEPEYEVYSQDDMLGNTQWKFYSTALDGLVHKSFKWPYLDLFFFSENDTHLWDDTPRFSKDYSFPKSHIFPIVKRPFGDMFLNAPCRTRTILDQNYHIDLCRSRQFSHSLEVPMFTFATKDVPCERLYNYFPFVHRTYSSNTINETLSIGDWSLQSIVVPSNCD